jgi:periplasmic divalent cation tolerance protein
MTDVVIVLCTFANQQDALRIASAVVEARAAACVNILGPVRSIYRWKGEVEQADEILVLIKTTQKGFPALRDRIKELHPYETPEIIAAPVVDGLSDYLSWVREQVS